MSAVTQWTLSFSVVVVCTMMTPIQKADGTFTFEEPPHSLLLPVQERGNFSCTVDCSTSQCTGGWLINNSYSHLQNNQPDPTFTSQGFTFPRNEIINGTKIKISLSVIGSEAVNNTIIECLFEQGDTLYDRSANLIVISDSPLPRNPMPMTNSTHVAVLWSPPYLWPGQPIHHYNVSFTNMSDGRVTHTSLNSTYSDPMVTFAQPVPLEVFACTEIKFGISAISSSGQLETFHASSYIAPNRIAFESSSMNVSTSMLYKADGSPAMLDVYIELPLVVCSFQQLNYTLLVEDTSGHLVMQYGPEQQQGHNVTILIPLMKQNLSGGRRYTVKVQVGLHSELVTSNKHYFNTTLMYEQPSASSRNSPPYSSVTIEGGERYNSSTSSAVYLGIMIIALVMLIVMAVVIVFLIVCVYTRRKQQKIERCCNDSKRRVFNTMVPNPIYSAEEEGPVYDCIRPQYETLVAVSPQSTTEGNLGDGGKKTDHDDVRYVDQPVHLNKRNSQSFTPAVSDTIVALPPRSFSLSGPPIRPVSLKKNGEERNKLHLTLDLCEGGTTTTSGNLEVSGLQRPVSENPSENQEESYMVMNPVQAN